MSRSFAIVGAGFSGAVVARELAEDGHRITVFDSRSHVAGNCFTERQDSDVMVHVYGHTSSTPRTNTCGTTSLGSGR